MKLTIKTLYLIFFCTRVLLKYSIKLFLQEIFAIKHNMSEKKLYRIAKHGLMIQMSEVARQAFVLLIIKTKVHTGKYE